MLTDSNGLQRNMYRMHCFSVLSQLLVISVLPTFGATLIYIDLLPNTIHSLFLNLSFVIFMQQNTTLLDMLHGYFHKATTQTTYCVVSFNVLTYLPRTGHFLWWGRIIIVAVASAM